MKVLTPTERVLVTAMEHGGEVVACGIVEVRAAQRLVDEGVAVIVSERTSSVDRWGAGSLKIRKRS